MKRIYFRKTRDALGIEGRTTSGKPLQIYTLGTAEKHLNKLLDCACFFTKEKETQIRQKLARVGSSKEKSQIKAPNVRPMFISRTFEKDAHSPVEATNDTIVVDRISNSHTSSTGEKQRELTDAEKQLLWELTKE